MILVGNYVTLKINMERKKEGLVQICSDVYPFQTGDLQVNQPLTFQDATSQKTWTPPDWRVIKKNMVIAFVP